MKHIFKACLASILLLLSACKSGYDFKTWPDTPVNHQLIVVAKTIDGVRAYGLSGAVPAYTSIFFEAAKHNQTVVAGVDGSFRLDLPLDDKSIVFGELTFSIGTAIYQKTYQIKDLAIALNKIAKSAFSLDQDIEDIAVVGSGVAILSPLAGLIKLHQLKPTWEIGDSTGSIALNPQAKPALYPRMIATYGYKAVIPMFGSNELALIDLPSNKLTYSARLKEADTDNAERVIAIDEQTYLASFVNFRQFSDPAKNQPAILGPGMIALLRIQGESIVTENILALPYKNPQFFKLVSPTEIWVSCTGAFSDLSGTSLSSVDAGLVKIGLSTDKKTLSINHHIALTNFTPAEPEVLNGKLIIPEAWGTRLAILDQSASGLSQTDIKPSSFHRPFNFTFATYFHGDIIFLGDAQGALIAYSLSEGFFPFPFVEPINLVTDQSQKIRLNPSKIMFRHREESRTLNSKHIGGFSAWVLSPSQHKIIPLDLLEVFGP